MYKIGDILFHRDYVKIDKVEENAVHVKHLFSGQGYEIRGHELINLYASATHFTSSKKVSQSALIEKLLETANGDVFTVGFLKTDGSLRLLRGLYIGEEHLFGRTRVRDLDIVTSDNLRLVDHRTLQFIIVNNVLYIGPQCTYTDQSIIKDLNVNFLRFNV